MKKLTFVLMLAVILLVVGCSSKEQNTTGLKETEINNDAFKTLFPAQYASYQQNTEMSDTKYAGSENRSKFSSDKEPYLPILFYKYGFSLDYNEDRGHSFAIEDLEKTLRVTDKTPGACLTCKSSAVPALYKEMGDNFWSANLKNDVLPKAEKAGHSAIGCSDCHDPENMNLRVTRPSFIAEMKEKGIDVKKASNKDLQNYVCGQCHAEYYFNAKTTEVTHPWDYVTMKGQTTDNPFFQAGNSKPGSVALAMYVYYQSVAKERGFNEDFIHDISGTPILKAQHPDFEMTMDGNHGKAGVTCVDCHMTSELTTEGKTITSHHITSPLKNPETCLQGGCHSDTPDVMKQKAESIQTNFKQLLDQAEEQSVRGHYYINKMISSGASAEKIADAQEQMSFAQWLWDFCAAENSTGFHNPAGADYILNLSLKSSEEVLSIAKSELIKNDVSIAEVDAEIAKIKQAVAEEPDSTKKRDHAISEYFPSFSSLEAK